MKKQQIITGERFGKLTVLELSHYESNVVFVKYRCDCGNVVVKRHHHVKSGSTNSCGCLLRLSPPAKSHGMTNTKEYSIWSDMKKRCYNTKAQNYKYYGGKGIKVCERWLYSFINFYEDMGNLPTSNSSIERISNLGDYCKSNCKWIDMGQQASNRTNSLKLTYKGDIITLKEFSRRVGLHYSALYNHFKTGTFKEYLLKRGIDWKD